MPKAWKEQSDSGQRELSIELSAALVAVNDEAPKILLVRGHGDDSATHSQFGLPCGPFDPIGHRTLEEGLRTWVREQSGIHLGYTEQLYTLVIAVIHRNVKVGRGPSLWATSRWCARPT